MYSKIKDLPEDERPMEKFMTKGAFSVSDAELLAIILRSGTRDISAVELAGRILNCSEQGILGINNLSIQELLKIKGIGRVKAIQIKAIGELSRRLSKAGLNVHGKNFNSPDLIARYYMEDLRYLKQEQLLVIYLDTKAKFIKDEVITKGTVNMSVVSPREIFINAVRFEAVNIILLHNHPSGDPTPGRQDILATKRVREAGELIGISLIDHIIIGDNKYISFKEEGLL